MGNNDGILMFDDGTNVPCICPYYLDARNLDQGEQRHQTIQFIMLCNDGKIYRYLFGAWSCKMAAMYEVVKDYSYCPAGSVGTFSTFGFLTFLLILLNVLLNLSTMSTILAINSINAAN